MASKRSAIQATGRAPVRITLSEAIHRTATELSYLPMWARDNAAFAARASIDQINRLLVAGIDEQLGKRGDIFANGDPADCIVIRRSSYPSAHHAAVALADLFMGLFWSHLDPEGFEASRKRSFQFYENPRDEKVSSEYAVFVNSAGLAPERVEQDWGKARPAILELLPADLEQALRTLPARIVRERVSARLNEPVEIGPVKLSDSEATILRVVRAAGYIESQEAVLKAIEADTGEPPSEGTTKMVLAGMVRHGLLESGTNGRGYQPGWLARYIPS